MERRKKETRLTAWQPDKIIIGAFNSNELEERYRNRFNNLPPVQRGGYILTCADIANDAIEHMMSQSIRPESHKKLDDYWRSMGYDKF